MIKTRLVDGSGTEQTARVTDEGRLNVIIEPRPPRDQNPPLLPFVQFFHDVDGNTDMTVNGSVENKSFYIEASPDFDTYIKTITALIADSSPKLADFGSAPRLANGLLIGLFSQDRGEQFLDEPIFSNYDFIRLGLGSPAFGSSLDAYRASNVIGTADAYSPVIDVAQTFGLPWGIRLRKGTEDRLTFTVRDDLSTLSAFNIEGFGTRL